MPTADCNGTASLGGRSVTVNNVAPTTTGFTVTRSLHDALPICQSVTVSGSFTDPALGVATETFTAEVAWGNGDTSLAVVSGGTFTATYTYADDTPSGTAFDTYAVSVTVTDDDTGTDTLGGGSVTVNDVAPTVTGSTV